MSPFEPAPPFTGPTITAPQVVPLEPTAPPVADIVAEKQRLRDITNQVDTMTTVEELKTVTALEGA